jgi:hypothetical protein
MSCIIATTPLAGPIITSFSERKRTMYVICGLKAEARATRL